MREVLVGALSLLPGSIGRRAAYIGTRARLDAGRSAPRTARLVHALLRDATSGLSDGDDAAAAEALTKALTLLFHPSRSAGDATPAMLRDPEGTLDVLGVGPVAEVLGRASRTAGIAPRVPVTDRAARILVISGGGLSFLEPVITSWRADGHEVGTLQITDLPADQRPSLRTAVQSAVASWRTGELGALPEFLVDALDGVDHLHVEWGDEVAAWLSHLDLGSRSLSVRIHKYEILTAYPQLLDASRVDTLCFVAPHVRDAALAISPRLALARRIDVTQNALDLERFADAEAVTDLAADLPGPEHVLGLVGWAGPAKDADWALDVLDALLDRDDGPWRLLLVGPEPTLRGADAERAGRLLERISGYGERVQVLGRREDVPAVLPHLGWVISASLIEGTHEAVAEGAVAGRVPVVRDWPQVRAYGGAKTVYPASWLVQEPQQAARRILESQEEREREGRDAEVWIRRDRDPQVLASLHRAWIGTPYDHQLRGDALRPEGDTA
jgi:hypothetical protein